MRVGIAADHGGFELKTRLATDLETMGHEVMDYGAREFRSEDDYPDYIIPLARAVARGEIDRGLAVCGSGVGACIAANKVPGARAALVTEAFSAHQGVEDDDMNLMCLGGRVIGHERMAGLGIDLDRVTQQLEDEGIEKFVKPFDSLLATLAAKRRAVLEGRT